MAHNPYFVNGRVVKNERTPNIYQWKAENIIHENIHS